MWGKTSFYGSQWNVFKQFPLPGENVLNFAKYDKNFKLKYVVFLKLKVTNYGVPLQCFSGNFSHIIFNIIKWQTSKVSTIKLENGKIFDFAQS